VAADRPEHLSVVQQRFPALLGQGDGVEVVHGSSSLNASIVRLTRSFDISGQHRTATERARIHH
jgi:hypothetical protein